MTGRVEDDKFCQDRGSKAYRQGCTCSTDMMLDRLEAGQEVLEFTIDSNQCMGGRGDCR